MNQLNESKTTKEGRIPFEIIILRHLNILWRGSPYIRYVTFYERLEHLEEPNSCIDYNKNYVGDCKQLNADIRVENSRFDRELLANCIDEKRSDLGTEWLRFYGCPTDAATVQVFKTVCGFWNNYGGNLCPDRRCTARQYCALD